ncbi:MAG: hypothetical protein ACRD17_04225 [Terriglobales bacterium]
MALLALVLAVGVPPLAAQAVQIGVDPLRVSYQLQPGGTLTDAAHISNLGLAPVPMTATVNDWRLSANGTQVFAPAGARTADPYACSSWLRINPVQFVLGPGQSATVRYSIQVPAHAPDQGCHAAILFTTAPVLRPSARGGILTRARLATILYLTVGHPHTAGHLTDISLAPPVTAGGAWQLRLRIANTGNTFFRASGTASLLAAGGQVLASFPLGSQVVLSQSTRVLSFPYPSALPPGNYQLRAQVDIGLPQIQEIEKPVTVAAPAAPAAPAPASAAPPPGPPAAHAPAR